MGLVGKVKGKVMGKILVTLLTKAAEGDFGPGVAKVYWALAGRKTLIGAALAFAAGAIQAGISSGMCSQFALDCGGWELIVRDATAYAAAFFLLVGQVDGAARARPPVR